jgi:hypothetical protein
MSIIYLNTSKFCIQYMCGRNTDPAESRIRDGTTTNTIPNNEAGYTATDANGEFTYGLHEPFSNYRACQTRTRNMGLWIADREAPSTPDRTTMETDTDTSALKRETIILTGTHLHGETLPSSLNPRNTATSTNPSLRTLRARTTAETRRMDLLLNPTMRLSA